mgnify:CR=1 FL=1
MAQDKDDVLARFRFREFAIMALITIQAILANLPREYLEETLGIDYSDEAAGPVLETLK